MLSKKTDFSLLLCQIIFGSFLLLFCSCGNNEPMPVIEATVVFKNVTPQNSAEILTISATVDTIIRLKKGTIIAIEENSFADADGNLITGEVDISVKEVISTADILSENMSTVTKEGILETAGMLKIDATSEGKTVQVADGKTLEIAFPKTGEANKDMQLYYGVESEFGVLEWELADADSQIIDSPTNAPKTEIFLDIHSFEIIYKPYQPLSDEINSKKTIESFRKKLSFTKEEMKYLNGEYARISFHLFDDGDLDILNVSGSITKQWQKEIKEILDKKYITPFNREGKFVDLKAILDISFGDTINELLSSENYSSNYYLLNTTKLGWINCDFFLEFTEPKIEMAITAPNKNTALKMMFTNYRTIMTGDFKDGKYVFANIPKGEPVKIIAISKEDDKAGFSLTEAVVQEELKELQPLEIMSHAALNDKIAKL